MTNNTAEPLQLPDLIAYRRAAADRRAGAFVPGSDLVLGVRCQPITPASVSMMLVSGSRFLCGGQPMEGDVRNYLWFHSPLFVTTDHPDCQRRRAAALRRFRPSVSTRLRSFIRWPATVDEYCVRVVLAVADITRLVEDAFADAPAGGGKPGGACASLEAQLIHVFAEHYGWLPERTSHTPLRQLFQILRAMHPEAGDAGEQAIIADYLRRKNAELAALRAQPPQEESHDKSRVPSTEQRDN